MDVIIYCDEAGNSGPNYVDPGQPFYVLAAWAVPYTRIADAAAIVEEHRQTYSPQAPELKSSNLLKSDKGKSGAISLIESLGGLGSLPFYVIAEKRYCIAGKIVETFLDPLFNPLVTNAFIPDRTTKQEIANTLYERLTDEELNQFASAYRGPTRANLASSLDAIIAATNSRINQELAGLLEGSRAKLSEIAEIEASVSMFGSFGDTLNHPVLSSMFLLIEEHAKRGLFHPMKFVHDRSHAYEAGFKASFEAMKDRDHPVFKYPYGQLRVEPMVHIPAFEIADSRTSALVQAADLLAGSIRQWAIQSNAGAKVGELDAHLAMLTLPAIFDDFPKLAWTIGSDSWFRQLGNVFFRDLVQQNESERAKAASLNSTSLRLPAPLFPIVNPNGGVAERTTGFKLPNPVYGVVETATGQLVYVDGLDWLSDRGGTLVPLFVDEGSAAEVARRFDHGSGREAYKVRAFHVRDYSALIELLEASLAVSKTVGIQRVNEPTECTDTASFVGGMRRILERAARAFRAGIGQQLYQVKAVGEIHVGSMLVANGSYVALVLPDGPTFSADTRQKAISAAVDHANQLGSGGPEQEQRASAQRGSPLA